MIARLGALAAVAFSLQAQPFGSFTHVQSRLLGPGEFSHPSPVRARLPLTLVMLRGSNWSEKRIVSHVRRTAGAFAACGVGLGPVTLVKAKAPDGRHDLDMTDVHPQAGVPRDVFRIAHMLPASAGWPVVFFAGKLIGDDALARSYGLGEVRPGRERDFPYMSSAWIAYKTHWIEREDEEYSSLAHELAHLLCECGHVSADEPHLMHTHRNRLSSRILPEHCDAIRASPLLSAPADPEAPSSN